MGALREPWQHWVGACEAEIGAFVSEQVRWPRRLLGAPFGVDVPAEGRDARVREQVGAREEQGLHRHHGEEVVFGDQALDFLAVAADLVVAVPLHELAPLPEHHLLDPERDGHVAAGPLAGLARALVGLPA